MGKIILINGPASSGKDTAAKHIRQWYQEQPYKYGDQNTNMCSLDRMAMPIKRAFAGTMGLPCDLDGNVLPYEQEKEDIIPLFGISYRQWQIDFSEKFLKQYGTDIFGQLLVTRIIRRFVHNIANLVVIPDCGFSVEIGVLYQHFNPRDILLIRCHRAGYTFAGDSRGYVHAPSGCAVFDPLNELQDEYLKQIEAGIKCWLETPERMPKEI